MRQIRRDSGGAWSKMIILPHTPLRAFFERQEVFGSGFSLMFLNQRGDP